MFSVLNFRLNILFHTCENLSFRLSKSLLSKNIAGFCNREQYNATGNRFVQVL